MNIDFHYGMIYVVARLAGLDNKRAETVAHACQYVDDSTTPGILEFTGGESYERFASAHAMNDFKNAVNKEDKVVWAPFHFLPAGQGDTLEEKSVCKPDSEIAKQMVRRAIEGREANNALQRLGISLHVYVDTWAHQGFTGTISRNNKVTSLEGDDYDQKTWFGKVKEKFGAIEKTVVSEILDDISGLGHGAALHFPDMPWAKWKYTNGYGKPIERNNLPDFVQAADMACKAVQGFIHGNVQYETEQGLNVDAKKAIESLLESNKDHDEQKRLEVIMAAVASGAIPGIKENIPTYISKGEGSWKHLATGIAAIDDGGIEPDWSNTFEDSDYRKFHDAIKQHRFVVTQEILPAHGVRLA